NLQTDPGELHNNYRPDDASTQKFRRQLADLKGKTDVQQTDSTESAELPDPKDKIEEQNLLHTAMLASEDNRPEKHEPRWKEFSQPIPSRPQPCSNSANSSLP